MYGMPLGWCLYFLLDFGVLYQLDLNSLWKSDAKNIFPFHWKWFLSLSSDFEVFASVRPYARICVFWWAAAVCRRTVGKNWAMVQKPSYLPQPMLARSIKSHQCFIILLGVYCECFFGLNPVNTSFLWLKGFSISYPYALFNVQHGKSW